MGWIRLSRAQLAIEILGVDIADCARALKRNTPLMVKSYRASTASRSLSAWK